MSRRKISQSEAWNLFHKIERLENEEDRRRTYWALEWPLGTHIGTIQVTADSALIGSLKTARKLAHAVVAIPKDSGLIEFIALPLAKEHREEK